MQQTSPALTPSSTSAWPLTTLSKLLLALCWVLLVVHVAMVVWAWPQLPDRLPMHFGVSGAPDSWAGKGFLTLGMLPALHFAILALLSWLIRHPEWSNLPSRTQFRDLDGTSKRRVAWVIQGMLASMAGVVSLILSVLSFSIVRIGLGLTSGLPAWFMALPGALLIILIVGIVAVRRCLPPQGSPVR